MMMQMMAQQMYLMNMYQAWFWQQLSQMYQNAGYCAPSTPAESPEVPEQTESDS